MGESKRHKLAGTYIASRGKEPYRGHMIEKMYVRLAGVEFWRVDVVTLGMKDAEPLFSVQMPQDKASLEKLVSEAKLAIGQIINQGASIPAASVAPNYMAKEPLDRLNMRSSTGKAALCDHHWRTLKEIAQAGGISLLVANILIMQRFTKKLYSDGLLIAGGNAGVRDKYTMNMLLDSYAPLCCWLGEEAFAKIIRDSDPVMLLQKAKEASV